MLILRILTSTCIFRILTSTEKLATVYASPPFSPSALRKGFDFDDRPTALNPVMEYNDPSRRQYAQNQYAAQQQPHAASQNSGQYAAPGSVERFRQSSYIQQSPNTVPSTGRASSDAQVYGFAQGTSQYAGPASAQAMQYATDLQQNPDVPRQQENSQYQQYGSTGALYGMGQQTQQTTQSPYDQVSRYPQRPGTATETLASQFGVPQTQYYLAGQSIPTGATAPELAAPHLPSQYQQSAYPPAGSSSSQTYGSNMIDPSQPAYQSYSQYTPTASSQSVDQAFSNYQAQMRSIFSQVRGGSLREVGSLLMDASHYLIGNAEALGENQLLPLRADHSTNL